VIVEITVFNFIRSKKLRSLNTKMSAKNKKCLEIAKSNERGQCHPTLYGLNK
jgi:hypothetical protein